MHYDPRQDARPLPYDPFKSCTVPRPIGWLSTISRDGKANLAPFSQWQNITYDPPIVMFFCRPACRWPQERYGYQCRGDGLLRLEHGNL